MVLTFQLAVGIETPAVELVHLFVAPYNMGVISRYSNYGKYIKIGCFPHLAGVCPLVGINGGIS